MGRVKEDVLQTFADYPCGMRLQKIAKSEGRGSEVDRQTRNVEVAFDIRQASLGDSDVPP